MIQVDRLQAKLAYCTGEDRAIDALTLLVRFSAASFVRALLEPPIDSGSARRILDALDWALFFKSWEQNREFLSKIAHDLNSEPAQGQSKDDQLDLTTFSLSLPSMAVGMRWVDKTKDEFLEMDRDLIAGGAARTNALRRLASEVLHEGVILAMVARIATDDTLFGSEPNGANRRQEEIIRKLKSEDEKGRMQVYMSRISSVEVQVIAAIFSRFFQ